MNERYSAVPTYPVGTSSMSNPSAETDFISAEMFNIDLLTSNTFDLPEHMLDRVKIVRNSPNFQTSVKKKKSCPFCAYTTDYGGNMSKHIRLHTKEKPYACQYCTYSATQSTHLKAHIVCVHRDILKLQQETNFNN